MTSEAVTMPRNLTDTETQSQMMPAAAPAETKDEGWAGGPPLVRVAGPGEAYGPKKVKTRVTRSDLSPAAP